MAAATLTLVPGRREHELAAVVAFLRARLRQGPSLAATLEQVGSAVRLAQGGLEECFERPSDPSSVFRGTVSTEDLSAALADVTSWLEAGHDMHSVLDDSYPTLLRQIFDRPPLVFVHGSWRPDVDWRSVSVVGTRRASLDGLGRARKLSRELVDAGFTVVSGLARGIDTAAHTAALAAGGRTIAVLGAGLEHTYPPENRDLARQIEGGAGALVSQFFPHQSPARWTFPMRNAVMSGLSLATVVVEASSTSGAKLQARLALRHGRAVFLLRSLLAAHSWARDYVEEGKYGTRAVQVESTDEIVGLLDALALAEPLAV